MTRLNRYTRAATVLCLACAACSPSNPSQLSKVQTTTLDSAQVVDLGEQKQLEQKQLEQEQTGPVPPLAETLRQPVSQEPQLTFEQAMKEGLQLAERGQSDQALVMFSSAVRLDEKQAQPDVELARLAIGKRDFKRAAFYADRALKKNDKLSSAWNTRGRIYLIVGEYKLAEQAFSAAAKCNPKNIYAHNNLGLARLQLGNLEGAIEALERATSSNAVPAFMYNNLGLAYERRERNNEALRAFKIGLVKGSMIAGKNFVRLERKLTGDLGG